MTNLPLMRSLNVGAIRHFSKTSSPFLARGRNSASMIATMRKGYVATRALGDCSHSFTRVCNARLNFNSTCTRLNSTRSISSGASTGPGKASAGASHELQEAARKHREIQSLLQQGSPSSASAQPRQPPQPSMEQLAGRESNLAFLHQLREQQREQKRRQAIINTVLSFLMVVLAAQGAKNGQERRKAQEGRDQAEQELLRIRGDLRKVIDSDECLERMARDCLGAVDDASRNSDGRARFSMFARWSSHSSHEGHEARVRRMVKALRQGLATQLASVMLSDEEKERQEMEQLASFASSALSLPDATTSSTASSGLTSSLPVSSSSPPPEQAGKQTAPDPLDSHMKEPPNANDGTAPKKVFMF